MLVQTTLFIAGVFGFYSYIDAEYGENGKNSHFLSFSN